MKKIIFISILIIAMLCSCANDVMLKFFDKMNDNAYVELGIYSPDVSAAEDLADIVEEVETEEVVGGKTVLKELDEETKDEITKVLDEVKKSQSNKDAFVEKMNEEVEDDDLEAAVKATYEKVKKQVEAVKDDSSSSFKETEEKEALDNAQTMLDKLANKDEITQADVLQAQLLADAVSTVEELSKLKATATDDEKAALTNEIINDANTILTTASVLAGDNDVFSGLVTSLTGALSKSVSKDDASTDQRDAMLNDVLKSLPEILDTILYDTEGELDLNSKITYLYSILIAYENVALLDNGEGFTGYNLTGAVNYLIATVFTTLNEFDSFNSEFIKNVNKVDVDNDTETDFLEDLDFMEYLFEKDAKNKSRVEKFLEANMNKLSGETKGVYDYSALEEFKKTIDLLTILIDNISTGLGSSNESLAGKYYLLPDDLTNLADPLKNSFKDSGILSMFNRKLLTLESILDVSDIVNKEDGKGIISNNPMYSQLTDFIDYVNGN